jgi:hypothetical protein
MCDQALVPGFLRILRQLRGLRAWGPFEALPSLDLPPTEQLPRGVQSLTHFPDTKRRARSEPKAVRMLSRRRAPYPLWLLDQQAL